MEEKDPLAVDPLETIALDGSKKFTYVSPMLSSAKKKKNSYNAYCWGM